MTKIKVNGREIIITPTKSTFRSSASEMSKKIYRCFEKIGITAEYIELNTPRNPLKKNEVAEICWYVNEEDFYYSCDKQERYIDNLGVIAKIIDQDTYAIRNGMKSFAQVMNQFKLGYDETGIKDKTPREVLGVPDYMDDLNYIKFMYKKRAKEVHPDQGGAPGDMEELTKAYQQIQDELEGKNGSNAS